MDANSFWIAKDNLLTGAGTQEMVGEIGVRVQQMLTTIGNSNNFHLFVAAERIMCSADLKFFQNMQQKEPDDFPPDITMNSLREGADQMDEINAKLVFRAENVEAFHRYSSRTQRNKADHDGKDLPKDGIRKLLPSHKTRLDNLAKGWFAVSGKERTLLRLRKMNIERGEQLYRTMQREALSIKDKTKSQGRQQ